MDGLGGLRFAPLKDRGACGPCTEKTFFCERERRKKVGSQHLLEMEKFTFVMFSFPKYTGALHSTEFVRYSIPPFLPPFLSPLSSPSLMLFTLARISSEFGKEVRARALVHTVNKQRAGVIADVLVARLRCVLGRGPIRFPGLGLGRFGILAGADEIDEEVCALAVVHTINKQRAGVIADILVARLCCVVGWGPVCLPWLCLGYLGGAGRHSC